MELVIVFPASCVLFQDGALCAVVPLSYQPHLTWYCARQHHCCARQFRCTSLLLAGVCGVASSCIVTGVNGAVCGTIS
jgi:hypothetical protein